MNILNLGSLNIDNVYKVDEFLSPGETKLAGELSLFCGGKGLNQSIAAARAGNRVFHAGLVGEDGAMLLDRLRENGVDTSLLFPTPGRCGHAIIQVNSRGENCILLYGGSNRRLTHEIIDRIFDAFGSEGAVLLQNEVNLLPYIIDAAVKRGLRVFLNAAPMDAGVLACPLEKLDWLIVNEVEGSQLAGCGPEDDILTPLALKYPGLSVLLTLGSRGAMAMTGGRVFAVDACPAAVVDTTAAGDTFTGYFLYGILHGETPGACLRRASVAAALCVGRPGASDSVPRGDEVDAAMAGGLLPPTLRISPL